MIAVLIVYSTTALLLVLTMPAKMVIVLANRQSATLMMGLISVFGVLSGNGSHDSCIGTDLVI